jgi:hypothetical protein
MNAIPGSKVATVATKVPPPTEGEPFSIYLEFEDGGLERHRRTDRAPSRDGATKTSTRAVSDAARQQGEEGKALPLPFVRP